MVHQFEKCCCTNLRTGTIIIGALGLLGGVYYTIQALLNLNTESQRSDGMPGGSVSRVISAIMGIVNIILCVVLIMGAVKRNAKMVYPWIVVSVVMVALFIIISVASGVYACISGHIGIGLGLLFSAIIFTLIQVYFILIVNSFYTNLKNGDPVATQQA